MPVICTGRGERYGGLISLPSCLWSEEVCGLQLRLILFCGPLRSICLPSLTSSSCSFPRIRSIDLGLFLFIYFFGVQKSSLVYMLREEKLGRYCCISSLWLTLPLLRGQLHIRETLPDNLYLFLSQLPISSFFQIRSFFFI